MSHKIQQIVLKDTKIHILKQKDNAKAAFALRERGFLTFIGLASEIEVLCFEPEVTVHGEGRTEPRDEHANEDDAAK